MDKPFPITKQMVWEAYLEIKGKGKAAGVDQQSLEDFNTNLADNLYRLWNRMASGSYFPPAVRRVEIPKGDGRKTVVRDSYYNRPYCSNGCQTKTGASG